MKTVNEIDDDINQLVAAQDNPFKYAVFSGGGAKGAIYSGVYEEMVNSGVLSSIEAIAGSSAGAITAAFIATGISVSNMKKTFQETNLNDLQGSGIIEKDAIPLYDLLHNTVNNNIIEYFDKNDLNRKCELRMENLITELEYLQSSVSIDQYRKIDLISDKIQQLSIIMDNPSLLNAISEKAQNNGKITFADLDKLSLIDPVVFKGLVVTATNKTTGELTIFDAEKTPNVEIALACRASASLPLRFKPVIIDGQEYVDGGVRDNIPQNHFEDKDNIADDVSENILNKIINKRTLVLAFGSQEENSPAHIAIYSAQEKITNFGKVKKFLLDVVLKFTAKIGGEFALTEDENQGFENLRQNALNTVLLDTKDVTTLDFKKAEKKAEYLHVKGKLQTARYFDNHFIGNDQDINLERKEFILNVYEKNKQEDMNLILNLCKDETWNNNDKNDILTSLINESAYVEKSKQSPL